MAAFAQEAGTVATPLGGWGAVATFIVQPYVTIALLVAGCLLLFHDLLTPLTWGVTGTLGVICMVLVFAAFITLGDRGWAGELLLLAGLAMILLEIHVFPGHGSALAGFILMFAGMFNCLGGAHNPVFALSITSFLIAVSGLAFLAYLPKSPAWQRLRAQMEQKSLLPSAMNTMHPGLHPILTHGQTVSESLEAETILAGVRPGHTGRTLTALRPIGEAEINGRRIPVVTEGDFLTPNTAIVVTEVEDGRIVVALQVHVHA